MVVISRRCGLALTSGEVLPQLGIEEGTLVLSHDPRDRRAERARKWMIAFAALISALAAVLALILK